MLDRKQNAEAVDAALLEELLSKGAETDASSEESWKRPSKS